MSDKTPVYILRSDDGRYVIHGVFTSYEKAKEYQQNHPAKQVRFRTKIDHPRPLDPPIIWCSHVHLITGELHTSPPAFPLEPDKSLISRIEGEYAIAFSEVSLTDATREAKLLRTKWLQDELRRASSGPIEL